MNDLPVDGPTLTDSSYEQEWENLNDQFIQRWDEDDEDSESAFCWLHSLTPEMAEQLWIAASGNEALGDDQEEYPAWIPKTLLKTSESFWIDADQIQASYSRGSVIVDPSTRAWMAIGCGAAWDPTDRDCQLDPAQSERWDQFPETMGPLLRVDVSREEVDLPPVIKELLPYWQKLIQLHGQINKALTPEEEP